ncbi:MAG: serine hydrolase domain-containing protein [Desulfomonilia bacterium]|nr:serine hydrolase domain-containing protein [Desulfomonilia bacterium]
MDVQGYLVEVLSGKPFDVYLRETIFEPLGMKDTAFYVSSDKADRHGKFEGSRDIPLRSLLPPRHGPVPA